MKLPEPGEGPTAQLAALRAFPELAAALRSQTEGIIAILIAAVRSLVPAATDLPAAALRDHLPAILGTMAKVLESANQRDIDELTHQSPAQGLARFQQRYDVRELMAEDRFLRRVIIEQVEVNLGRRMIQAENVALDMSVDTMLQEAVVAFIGQQNDRLRTAAEAELKYLSFLSHDLNNNLSSVTLMLKLLRRQLADLPEFAGNLTTLDAAQQSISDTVGGMERLLQSERLRKTGAQPERRPIRLQRLAFRAASILAKEASAKGISIAVEVPGEVVIHNDGELIGLIVQNLLGNAVKYSSGGTIRVRASVTEGKCAMSVSDEGPGITAQHTAFIFDSFRRGDAHGQPGVGLGLTIAAQAAKLLDATLDVESKVGAGSTFTLTLPA